MSGSSKWICSLLSLATVGLVFLGEAAYGVDGVIEISQARALAGGVTPGDEPGFPVKLFEPGSYRLTGNLTVPNTNTGAIEVRSNQVSIDLNGFSIQGPGTCTGCPVTSCTGGTGRGVYVLSNIEMVSVRNGTIRGMGAEGILLGYQAQIENVIVRDNGARGISFVGSGVAIITASQFVANNGSGVAGQTLTVKGSKAQCNAGSGIELGEGEVSGNTSDSNGEYGILLGGGLGGTIANNVATRNSLCGIRGDRATIVHNSARSNSQCGITSSYSGTVIGNTLDSNGATSSSGKALNLDPAVGFSDNVLSNHGSTPWCDAVSGGIEMGHNVCDGLVSCALAYCPFFNPVCGPCIP